MNLSKVKLNPKWLLSFLAGMISTLSLAHHWIHFWELSLMEQILVLLAVIPVFVVVFYFLLKHISTNQQNFQRGRWLAFLIPALAVAAFSTWAFFRNPVVWHALEVVPIRSTTTTPIQLLEVKSSNGGRVNLSAVEKNSSWSMQDGVLTAKSDEPLKLSFLGPVGQPARLTFLTGPQSGRVRLILDGTASEIDLANSSNGPHIVQVNTNFRFGIPGGIFISVLIILDFLFAMIILICIWLVQEMPQLRGVSLQFSDGEVPWSHQNILLVLLSLSFVLHLINYFSVPLFLGEDSPTYLQGAVYWLKYHNLEGVSPFRGPVTTVFFLVPMLLFGRNPWGTKLFLHSFAFLIVPLSYYLGWQITRKRWFAGLVGLVTIFTPDLYEYANFIMSEIPNIFLVLLFCIVLLSTLEKLSLKGMIATTLTGSLTVLLRSENIMLLYIGIASLVCAVLMDRSHQSTSFPKRKLGNRSTLIKLGWISFATLLAVVPILGWSVHNYKYNGFFRLSDYEGEVLYTGWVYEGEASHIPITDKSSPAFQIIKEAYWNNPEVAQSSTVPTGWMIHPFLMQRGYTDVQAFDILKQAAIDSIKKNYRVTMDVLWIKIKDSFAPATVVAQTISLPTESAKSNSLKLEYYDEEKPVVPFLILIQRQIDQFWAWYFDHIYPVWAWFCLIATALCFYRKPFIVWVPIVLITMTRVLLPNIIGISHWRPVVSGIVLIQICGLAFLHSIAIFLFDLRNWKMREEPASPPSSV